MSGGAVRSLATIESTPWKNGRGTTRELLREPPGASLDDFRIRLSVAQVDADAQPMPFSLFPRVQRHLVLLDGGSIELHRADGRVENLRERDRVFEFDGAEPISARVVGNEQQTLPVRDFNVMVAAGCSARVSLLRAATRLPAPPEDESTLMLVCLSASGRWRVGPTELAPDEFLVLRGDDCRHALDISAEHEQQDDSTTLLLIVTQITEQSKKA